MRRVLSLFVLAAGATMPSHAQSNAMDVCQTTRDCDAAALDLIRQSRRVMQTERYRDAAQLLYPILLSDNLTIPESAKTRAADAFSDLLGAAELYPQAAMQAGRSNRATGAPSSTTLLKEARFLRLSGKNDQAGPAYLRAEALAVAAANLATIDALIAEYSEAGQTTRAENLSARRQEIAVRFDDTCGRVSCRNGGIIDASLISQDAADYPREALRNELTGSCTVSLNVSETGTATDVKAECTDPVFIESAEAAGRSARFTPRFENGTPAPRYNIIIPLE
ncbi:MAG: energy transducer TonB, partial [Pseudomonadota bacterium]